MKMFNVEKTPFAKTVEKQPWYVGIPLVVVLSPLFVLAAFFFIAQGWVREWLHQPEAPAAISPSPGWQDWARNEHLRLKIRPVRPTEASQLVDEWYAQVDIDEKQPLFYAETEPPQSPVHGAFFTAFRHETPEGQYLQRIWFVEDQEIALDSELVFVPRQGGFIQSVAQAGPYCLKVTQTEPQLILEGLNHDEGLRLVIS